MNYHIEHITSIVQGRVLQQSSNNLVEHLLIDSRRLIFPGTSLFFALKGNRRNGHLFIPELYRRGVRNFVVSDPVEAAEIPDANIIRVSDTLQALQQLAAWHRKQFDIPVIGITGSNGKTIVKEWLNQLLDDHYRIVRSPKSYNSQIGVPLSVWQMNANHQLAIFEAGISESGEMDKLQKIIQPIIGVFTNIGEAHSEGFLNLRQKINEKLRLFTNAKVLIYCRDYPELHEGVAQLWQQVNKGGQKGLELFNWSAVAEADFQLLNILKEDGRASITARYRSELVQFSIPFSDAASIENAIVCCCVLLYLGLPVKEIARRMPALGQVAMRLELKTGINHCSVINDSYSADLSSLKIALDFLAQQTQHARKTVILSDILQSGKSERELYREVAAALAERKVNRLVGIGERIGHYRTEMENAGIPESVYYPTVDEFIRDFHPLNFHDETILLKGARVFEFEKIDRLLEQKVHQTVLEIDLNALRNNLRYFQQKLNPGTRLMAMVKAFSYGSGSFEIAAALQYHKVDYLAVAYADEGVELRKAGITLPIMVMNPDESAFDSMVQYNLEPELYSMPQLASFDVYLKKQGLGLFPVHLELETGMNRLGFSMEDMEALLPALQSESIKVQTIFSHLVASEDPSMDEFTQQQAELFTRMSDRIKEALGYPVIRHISNTAGISRHPGLQFDMVRLGIGLYGVGSHDDKDFLREVSTLRSTIAQVKELKEGETVGYGRKGLVLRPSRVATVRIGYADGYPRSLGNGNGKMWLHHRLVPVIGNVCMDMTMIDVTDVPDAKPGDEVILFGKPIPVTRVAEWAGTIPYEILTGVSQRVKRVYFEE